MGDNAMQPVHAGGAHYGQREYMGRPEHASALSALLRHAPPARSPAPPARSSRLLRPTAAAYHGESSFSVNALGISGGPVNVNMGQHSAAAEGQDHQGADYNSVPMHSHLFGLEQAAANPGTGAASAPHRVRSRDSDNHHKTKCIATLKQLDGVNQMEIDIRIRLSDYTQLLLQVQLQAPAVTPGQQPLEESLRLVAATSGDEFDLLRKIKSIKAAIQGIPHDKLRIVTDAYCISFAAVVTSSSKTLELIRRDDMGCTAWASKLNDPSNVEVAVQISNYVQRVISMFGADLYMLVPVLMCICSCCEGFNVPSSGEVISNIDGSWSGVLNSESRVRYAAQAQRLFLHLTRMFPEACIEARRLRSYGGGQKARFTVGAPEFEKDGVKVIHYLLGKHRDSDPAAARKCLRQLRRSSVLPGTMKNVISAVDELAKLADEAKVLLIDVGYDELIQPMAAQLCGMDAMYTINLIDWMDWATCEHKCDYNAVIHNGLAVFLCDVRTIEATVVSTDNYVASAAHVEIAAEYWREAGGDGSSPQGSASMAGAVSGNRGGATIVCHDCGQTGHAWRACPSPDPAKTAARLAKIVCFNCDKKGHMSKDCKQPKRLRDRGAAAAAAAITPSASAVTKNKACVVCNKNMVDHAKIEKAIAAGRKEPTFCDSCFVVLRTKFKITGHDGVEHLWRGRQARNTGTASSVEVVEIELPAWKLD